MRLRSRPPLERAWDLLERPRRVLQEFGEDDCGFLAGGIAYQLFFALIPLFALLIGVFGLVYGGERSQAELETFVRQVHPAAREDDIELVRELVDGRAISLGIGVVGTIWSATAIFGALDSALAEVLGRGKKRRSFLRARLWAFAFVGTLGALALASFAASYGLQLIGDVASEYGIPGVVGVLAAISPLVGLVPGLAFFYLAFRMVPSPRPSRGEALRGAVVSALLWEVAKLAFAALTRGLGVFQAYGALAFVAGLLTWIYLSGAILLIGAEVIKTQRSRA